MPLARSDIERALQRKGFTYRSGDHRYYFFEHEGLTRAVFTKVSHGTKYKTLATPLVLKMAKQLRLTKKQFMALVDCSMTQEQYVAHLTQLGFLSD